MFGVGRFLFPTNYVDVKTVPNERGHFGLYGGMFVPETLMSALHELAAEYDRAKKDQTFQDELSILLRDFAGRPTPLYFAERLTRKLESAKIYLKREDLLHTGAHKINNALGQILLAQRMGKRRIIAETGAGQHGVATATVAARFGCVCVIYMGKVDMERQALNVARMKFLGAKVIPVKRNAWLGLSAVRIIGPLRGVSSLTIVASLADALAVPAPEIVV